jgi:hypothetical protein
MSSDPEPGQAKRTSMTAGAPAISDGRAADVARADQLLSASERDGAVGLPELSAAELCMLCDGRQILIEYPEYAWWYGLAPDTRDRLSAAAVSLLGFRQLLRPPEADREDGDPEDSDPDGKPAGQSTTLVMAPELSFVITARRQPTVLAVGTVSGSTAGGAPRLYGLAEPDGLLRAIVAEQVTSQPDGGPFGPVHKFALLSSARAGEALAAWASRPGQAREISIYRHQEGELLTFDSVSVTCDAGTLTVVRRRSGAMPCQPTSYDQSGLARLATAMLNGDVP